MNEGMRWEREEKHCKKNKGINYQISFSFFCSLSLIIRVILFLKKNCDHKTTTKR